MEQQMTGHSFISFLNRLLHPAGPTTYIILIFYCLTFEILVLAYVSVNRQNLEAQKSSLPHTFFGDCTHAWPLS